MRFENACSKVGYPLPLKIAGRKPPIFDDFRRLRNLTANTAYIFGTKHDINNRASASKLLLSYIVLNVINFGPCLTGKCG